MDHLNNNITSCMRVTQQYFEMTSDLFLNYLSSFIAECFIEVIKDQIFYNSSI